MCLAIPGKILECAGEEAVIDLQGNRLKISTTLTPDARVGDWVLAHAGFAITLMDEAEARETWDYLEMMIDEPLDESGAVPVRNTEDQASS